MPAVPRRLKAIQHPQGLEGKAGRVVEVRSIPRQQHLLNMTTDNSLRAIQRQNDLNAFIRYERRLARAYAQSKNPYPPRGRQHSHHTWRVRRYGQLDALD
jgi:hypothetical protein